MSKSNEDKNSDEKKLTHEESMKIIDQLIEEIEKDLKDNKSLLDCKGKVPDEDPDSI